MNNRTQKGFTLMEMLIVIGWKPAERTSKSWRGGGDSWTGGGPADGSSQEVIYY